MGHDLGQGVEQPRHASSVVHCGRHCPDGGLSGIQHGRHQRRIAPTGGPTVGGGRQAIEIEPGNGVHRPAHVGQRVLPCHPDEPEGEVRQHVGGSIPTDPIEQLERLLGVDDAVAVAQVVGRCGPDELTAERCEVDTIGQLSQHRRQGRPLVLHLDRRHQTVAPVAGRVGQRHRHPMPAFLGQARQPLDQRQHPVVAGPDLGQGQAVGHHRQLVAGTVLDPGKCRADRRCHDRGRRRFSVEESHRIAGDLTQVVGGEAPFEAGPELPTPLGRRWGSDLDLDVTGVDPHPVAGHVLFAEQTATGGHVELPVVPLAGHRVAGQRPGDEPIALVGAGVVEGVDTGRRSDQRQAVTADGDRLHGVDRQLVEPSNDGGHRLGGGLRSVGPRYRRGRLTWRGGCCGHETDPTISGSLEVKGSPGPHPSNAARRVAISMDASIRSFRAGTSTPSVLFLPCW